MLMDVAFSLYKRGHADHLRMVQKIASDPTTASDDERQEVEASIARLTAARLKFIEVARSMYPAKAEALGDEYQNYVGAEAWAAGQDAPLAWAMKGLEEDVLAGVRPRRAGAYGVACVGGGRRALLLRANKHLRRAEAEGRARLHPGRDDDPDVADSSPGRLRVRARGSRVNL